MTIPEKAVQWAEKIAADDSHGYDQSSRWGPDYDCSSLVISAYKAAGVPLQSTYTGNMWQDFLNHGFIVPKDVNLATGSGLRPGDVLLNVTHHTAMYIGDGKIIHATGNEHGGVTGGQTGDQTGREITIAPYYNFPWDCVLRYTGQDEAPTDQEPGGTYTVQPGDSLWSIAEKCLGDGSRWAEIQKVNGLDGTAIFPGQVLAIPGASAGPLMDATPEVVNDVVHGVYGNGTERITALERVGYNAQSVQDQVEECYAVAQSCLRYIRGNEQYLNTIVYLIRNLM